MAKVKSTITSKGQTTVPKPVRDALGVSSGRPIYWEIRDGAVEVSADEPAFFRWIGFIRTGRGSVSDDVKSARKRRGGT
jgi:AbrB family looped-hinge helix DNA binding protein